MGSVAPEIGVGTHQPRCRRMTRTRATNCRMSLQTAPRILKAQGLPPVPERPTTWQTFLRAHKDAIVGADFFTTEVWRWRGLVTVYTVFVIHLASRRVQILGSTPHPDEEFMRQVGRTHTMADAAPCRILICDRDTKWSGRSASVYVRQDSAWSRRRIRRRTRIRTRSGLFGQSKKNASTGSFQWASVTFNELYVNSSRTTISNGIIKGLGIR